MFKNLCIERVGFEKSESSESSDSKKKNVPSFSQKKMQEHVMNKLVSSKINALLRQRNLFLKSEEGRKSV